MTLGNWQEWVVALVVVLCVAKVALSIFQTYKRGTEGNSPCAGCASPCDIKRLYDKKRESCQGNVKKSNKSCCE
ncbi:MAG: hypothetical protein IJM43_10240 [Bacteroidaceae bacterium]|nr:hypothetical protein [Bacteroidaceae bacterium]